MDWLRIRKETLLEEIEPDTDARRSLGRRPPSGSDDDGERRIRFRRRAAVLLLAGVSGAGCIAAFVGEDGLLDLIRTRREIRGLERQIEARTDAVSALREEVWRLENETMARERVAREQLGLVRPGEVDFLLPRSEEPTWDAGLAVAPE